jgi:membrane-associated phospholipid phosphatase
MEKSLECEPREMTKRIESEVVVSGRRKRFLPIDVLVAGYTAAVALFVVFFHERVAEPGRILWLHAVILAAVILVPARGADWERARPDEPRWRKNVRGGLRFFRYSYPLLLILFFFEEVQQTVNVLWPASPHWFEQYLYSADLWVFGELPSHWINGWVGLVQDELMHGFYLSYYFILIGGIAIAWIGDESTERHPGPGFQTTLLSVITAFFVCFIWYPLLPARGPWENPEVMMGLTPFKGFLFTPVIEKIIEAGAVSGGCFPSSHVAGAWGIVFGLARFHRRQSAILGFFAVGLSLACVYTRYHHFADVPAGFLAGLTGAALANLIMMPKTSNQMTS